jgi:hypothetical protein
MTLLWTGSKGPIYASFIRKIGEEDGEGDGKDKEGGGKEGEEEK